MFYNEYDSSRFYKKLVMTSQILHKALIFYYETINQINYYFTTIIVIECYLTIVVVIKS